ncbi:hypothetical protein [Desulfuromonas thiophila]|uniref:Na+-driven multidrug efflux pump n=1 Tax=Desulfuromonas thiophila TaxID=57664 RepID=A0A1G6ZM59_9BACT|nr:hypothetical protein [Desulfuromonas thiophila]SDE03562.1 Na+-driven multidrug efflux pump [Desulfuromonas thiophila]
MPDSLCAQRLTLRTLSLFFFPLLLNVQLMSVSHAIINAALARLEDYILALAAFSVAMVVHLLFASPSYQNHTITIAIVRGRRSLRGMVLCVCLIATYVSLMLGLIAFTPLGDLLLRRILGVTPEIAAAARQALAPMCLLPFFTGFRGLFQGLVIRARLTHLVSLATGVRVGALLLLLHLGRPWFAGAQLGAAALLGCIICETALMAWFAWRCGIGTSGAVEKTPLEILRFALPVAFSSGLQQTIPVVISAIISRLPDAALALAAFGVIRALLFLLSGPMRNLQQAYLTLVETDADYRVLLRFFFSVSLGMAALTLAIALPFNPLILGSVLGLADDLRLYLVLPFCLCAIFPLFYGATNLLRAHFTASHQTLVLSQATLLKFTYLLLCWLGSLLLPPGIPGILLAIFLLISSECAEALFLRWRRAGAAIVPASR